MRRAFAALLAFALLAPLAACKKSAPENAAQVRIVTTIDALYELITLVGGERVSVEALVPPGGEAHDFEPKPRDIALIRDADLFVYNGLGMETWADGVLPKTKASLAACPAADALVTDVGAVDPHMWLSPRRAAVMAGTIRDALVGIDPAGAEVYDRNLAALTSELDSLAEEYAKKLRENGVSVIVTSHEAFGYLCQDFGLEERSVENLYAEGEPSARKLAELIAFCRENGVKTILAERAVSPETAKTLARESGAVVTLIYTMEGPEDGLGFMERMRWNLEQLAGGGA